MIVKCFTKSHGLSPILLGMPFRTKIQSENSLFPTFNDLEIEAVHKNKAH
jgi:hypothetical protein